MIRCSLVGVLCTLLAPGALGQPTVERTTSDGVFTAEQARRGQVAYTGPCDRCHGYKLDGAAEDPDMLPAPPVAGPKFLRKWNGRSVAALLAYLKVTMPANNPGYLTDAELADIIAYMLATSGMPSGTDVLPPDPRVLERIAFARTGD